MAGSSFMFMKLSNNKVVVIAVAITLFLICVIASKDFFKHEAWLLLNKKNLEKYANNILVGNTTPLPDSLIDYTIFSSSDYVVFSPSHDHDILYGYFPRMPPSNISDSLTQTNWKKLYGKWYYLEVFD